MWTRKQLKTKAKAAFKANYWRSVLAAILLTMAVGNGTASAISSASSSASTATQSIINDTYSEDYYENEYYAEEYDDNVSMDDLKAELEEVLPPVAVKLLTTITLSIVLVFALIAIIVRIFVLNPLEISGCNYFKSNASEQAELDTLSLPFKKKYYGKMVGIIFLRNLYKIFWTFLLIIPGIIKNYEYRMIPYILADAPGISRKEAFRISKEMMRGNKWKAFILDFSFIGWDMLAVCTCGILNLFFVNPYKHAANAELFISIREEYFKNRG